MPIRPGSGSPADRQASRDACRIQSRALRRRLGDDGERLRRARARPDSDGRGISPGAGCTITTGRWRSVYDGKILTTGRSADIDHIVPLAESWRSGANAWTAQRRERFANDLREPQLIAVSASSNRSKGDSPPQEWKPPRRAIWCLYSRWWIDVKTTYRLTVTPPKRRALRVMLRTCE